MQKIHVNLISFASDYLLLALHFTLILGASGDGLVILAWGFGEHLQEQRLQIYVTLDSIESLNGHQRHGECLEIDVYILYKTDTKMGLKYVNTKPKAMKKAFNSKFKWEKR